MAHAGGGGWICSKEIRVKDGVIWTQTLSAQLRDPLVVPSFNEALQILERNDGTITVVSIKRMGEALQHLKGCGFRGLYDNW